MSRILVSTAARSLVSYPAVPKAPHRGRREHCNGADGGTAKSKACSVPRFPQSNLHVKTGVLSGGLLHVVMLSGCTRGDKELLLVLR